MKDEKAIIAEFEEKFRQKLGITYHRSSSEPATVGDIKHFLSQALTDYKNHLEQTWREKVEGLKRTGHSGAAAQTALDAVLDITKQV